PGRTHDRPDEQEDLRGEAGLGRNRGALGRVRDFADDVGDVVPRVPDAALAVRAVALSEDLADALQLPLAAELAGVRLDLLQRAPDELRDGYAVASARREVHHRRLEPVAGGEPLV